MASIYDLKPRFQALLRPLIRHLARCGCTPNLITSLALLLSVAVGAILLFYRDHPQVLLLLPIWLFLRMALNAIDGMMARELNMKSSLGAVLNEVGDVLSDLALYLPLAVLHPPSLWFVIAFSLGAVLTEFCGVIPQASGGPRAYDGPMGKSDRAFYIGTLGLVTALLPDFSRHWPLFFALAAGLSAVTCIQRLRSGLAALKA
jgi:phosphatidylglycerophosphate synthase